MVSDTVEPIAEDQRLGRADRRGWRGSARSCARPRRTGRRCRAARRRTACRNTCRSRAGKRPCRRRPTARCRGRRGIPWPTSRSRRSGCRAAAGRAPGRPAGTRAPSCPAASGPASSRTARCWCRRTAHWRRSRRRASASVRSTSSCQACEKRRRRAVVGDLEVARPSAVAMLLRSWRRAGAALRRESGCGCVLRKYTSLTIASTGISNRIVCSHGPWIVMSISPDAPSPDRLRTRCDVLLVELEQAEEVDEIALDEAHRPQVGQFGFLELQRAEVGDLVADLVRRSGARSTAGIAALEAVLDLRAGEVVQHDLHHRELVQVGVEQAVDDHGGILEVKKRPPTRRRAARAA